MIENEKITVQTTVAVDLEKAWDAYTRPEHITQWNFADPSWHCPQASNDLRVGGRYHARMEAKDGSYGFDFEAVYTDVQPGIQFTYEFGGRRATVLFQASNHQTEVSVAFDPETENALELQRNGWQAILDNYRKHTESL